MAEDGTKVSAGSPIMGVDEAGYQHFIRVTSQGSLAVDTEQFAKFDNVATWPVADSASSVELLEANPDRRAATVRNTSSAILHICPGIAAASPNTAVKSLAANEDYTLITGYTGPVQGVWSTHPNDGVAVITEYTD